MFSVKFVADWREICEFANKKKKKVNRNSYKCPVWQTNEIQGT